MVTLLGELALDVAAQQCQQSFRLIGAEHFHQGAVRADLRYQCFRDDRFIAIHHRSQQARELPVVGGELTDTLAELPALGIQISLQGTGEFFLRLSRVVVELLAERLHESRGFALNEIGIKSSPRLPQRDDADLKRFERVLVAVGAFIVLQQCAQRITVLDCQFQRYFIGQIIRRQKIELLVKTIRHSGFPSASMKQDAAWTSVYWSVVWRFSW